MMREPELHVEIPIYCGLAINDAMNQLVVSRLEPRTWRAKLSSRKRNGRTIAAIFVHLHKNRLVWLKNSAPHLKCPGPLNPDRCTIKQASAAHKKGAAQCLRMLKGVGRRLGPPTRPCSRTRSRTKPIAGES
jgi:hypothetical protein